MKVKNQKGFSLIELLIVVVIVGIIATVALPYLMKAKLAAENASMVATLRTMSSSQIEFYTQNSRYALLSEINQFHGNTFGTTIGNNIKRGSFTLDMGVTSNTDASLKQDFTITATRISDSNSYPYVVAVNSSGQIVQITP